MSITLEKLRLVHVIDPRVDVNAHDRREYGVLSSGQENNFRVFPSTSFSSSSIDWTCNPSGGQVSYVGRRAYKRVRFALDFDGTAPAGQYLIRAPNLPTLPGVNPGSGTYDCPRNLPLSRAATTEKVVMNGLSFIAESGRYWHALERYHNAVSNQDGDASMSPSMPDQYQDYTNANGGQSRNPFRGYQDNPQQCPRGGYVNAVIAQNDLSTGANALHARIILTVTEPIYVSPFIFGENEEEQAFIGVETMSVNLQLGGRGNGTFAGLVGSLWSHSPSSDSVFTNAVATVQAADLLFNYLTPDAYQHVPNLVNYSLYNPVLYQTQTNAPISSGVNSTFNMNSVTLSSIPSRMYIWVADSDNSFDWTHADSFFGITNILAKFNNHSVQLSDATQEDLYQMAKRNGCNESYRQWIRDVGSVACVMFGNDLALESKYAAGVTGRFDLQLQIMATNLASSTITPTLNVLIIQEGVCTLGPNTAVQQFGPLTVHDVEKSKHEHPIKFHPSANVYGGGFWSDLLGYLKRGARAAIDVGKSVPSQYQGVFQAADPIARSLGFGVSGGKKISRAQMMKLLK